MSEEFSAIVSQMTTWDTAEIEDSFLSTCVHFLETSSGSTNSLCELVAEIDHEWFQEIHKKSIFHVIKKIALDSAKVTLVVPGSIAVMAQNLLCQMGYAAEADNVESVTTYPSSFFSLEILQSVIPLWRAKLARNRLKANAETLLSLLAGDPNQKVFDQDIPGLIEKQQEIWQNTFAPENKNDTWESSISEMLSPLPPDTSISTGLRVLDDAIQGGIAKRGSPYSSRLIVIAARPAMGKTAFAVFLATQLANYHGDIAFFSLEMPATQLRHRALSCLDYIELSQKKKLVDPIRINNLRLRSYSPAQRDRLESYASEPIAKRFHIFDKTSMAVNIIAARIKLLSKTRSKLTAVFIDYLQLIEGCSGDGQNSEASNVGNVTRALKSLALSLGIDIFLLCQVNRGVETRNDKMPTLSDLRASGRIEEDADIVAFLLRPGYYDSTKNEYELAISIAKNRHGVCGTLGCCIDLKSSVIFENARI